MVQVSGVEYDSNVAGGDSNVTKQIAYVDSNSANNRETSFVYDFRNRRTATDGEVDFYEQVIYDNLDRVLKTDRRNTTSAGNLIARAETRFDDRGRVYQSVRYGVDPTSGVVGYGLTDNTWFDGSGNVIKSQPAGSSAFTKSTYDGLGRTLNTYVGYDLSDSTYTDATTITGDSIFEQTEQTYDAASNAIQTTSRARYHSATGTGSLGSPSSTQPKARVTYAAGYPDALGRTVAFADYGTNGGTALSRSATIPTRSDTCLVTSMTFDVAGNRATTTDPAGLVVQMTFDARGRQTQQVKNPVTSSSSSSSSSSNTCGASDDTNVTVQTSYTADGQISTITAVNSNTGNQITQYVYGTTLSDSAIATSNLKRSEVYPDSVDSDDCIKFTYNRQGQVTTKTDQNGTVHSFDFDKLGRDTEDRVTTLASGVDGAVLRIEKTFKVRGMVEHITSYDNATVGSGAIVNDVLIAYNTFGQVTADYQSHSGAVNMASTPNVQYAYLSGSANSIRPTLMTYPNGRVLTYSYGTAGGANDALSRTAALIDNDGTTQLAAYQYLGLGTFVEVDYTEPDIKYTLIDLSSSNDPDTGDIYSGLDRFSRVKDCRWYNYWTSTDAVRIKHGYDRAGNRLYREDPVAASYGKAFDELYAYDRTYRLVAMQRGTLNGSKTRITGGSKTFEQCWTLDATGNWQGFREDSDGNSSWDLVQARSDNKVNEITGVTNSVGSAWTAPAYNRNGNMTTVPQPADPTKGYTATYDAWNRLVKIVDVPTGQTVQENAYDGRTFRVVKKSYTAGVLSETRQLFYSTGWQVVEKRVGAATAAERQFVWGLRYLDDLIVRDRDTTGGGSLIERLYALQDANWNVMAISNSAGVTQERYAYSSYGTPVVSTGTIGTRSSSSYLWEVLYGGYRSDSSSDLYSNRHRTYVPLAGIWLARDLIVYSGEDFNLYQYCQSAPQMFVDSLGLVMWPTQYYRDPDTGELIPIQVDRPHFDPSDLFPVSVIVSVPLRVWRLGYLGARFFRASATPILARLAAARAALGQVSGSALGGALGTVALLASPKHFRPSMVNGCNRHSALY